jgi:hypothetical protein
MSARVCSRQFWSKSRDFRFPVFDKFKIASVVHQSAPGARTLAGRALRAVCRRKTTENVDLISLEKPLKKLEKALIPRAPTGLTPWHRTG